jgi:indole-3-glycerol phosphate synthase
MKDIVVDPVQIDAASRLGANAVLLIQAIFDRGYCPFGLNEMVAKAHSKNLEVLLEGHTIDEFSRAVKTDADLVGINNRNLSTLQIDLNVTKNILDKCPCNGKVVISESGVSKRADVQFLSASGAKAFLIGSAVMSAEDVEAKVKEFVNSQ